MSRGQVNNKLHNFLGLAILSCQQASDDEKNEEVRSKKRFALKWPVDGALCVGVRRGRKTASSL